MVDKKRILLTGGFGFLGRNLRAYFREYVPGYTLNSFTHKQFDISIPTECQVLFKACEPDIVIHLAAECGGIGANQKSPALFWRDNLAMGINVLDGCVAHGIQKLIMLGSVCAYPQIAPLPFREESLCSGWPEITNRPYGIAKLALYEGCRAYATEYGLKYTYLIPTNMFGPFDNFDLESGHVIPAMIRKFHDACIKGDKQVVLWGDGTPTRDFLYVEDAVWAICLALEKATGGEPLNLGWGKEVSMHALAEMVRGVTGYEGEIVWDMTRPNGQPKRAVDASKAKRILGWAPQTGVYDGIKRAYQWWLTQKQPVTK